MADSAGQVPTVTIVGKKGKLIINASDLAEWKAKGYKTEAEAAAEANKKDKKE